MTIETSIGSEYGFRVESQLGVAPVGTYTLLRRVSGEGVQFEKDTYDSEEISRNRQLADSRHGTRRVLGDFETELSPASFNELFRCLMGRTSWSTVLGGAPLSVVADFLGSSVEIQSGGTFANLHVGAGVTITGASAANNGLAIVTSVSADSLTITLDKPLVSQVNVSITLTPVGAQLTVGSVPGSLSVERAYRGFAPDAYQLFTGVRIAGVTISVISGTLVRAVWSLYGQDSGEVLATTKNTYASGAAYDPAGLVSQAFDAIGGSIYIDGPNGIVDAGTITEYSLVIDNQLGADSVVGSDISPDIVWGNYQAISGTLLALLTDETTLYEMFEGEITARLLFTLSVEGTQSEFLTFHIPRCKLQAAEIGDAEDIVPVDCDFTALLPSSATPSYPRSQLIIHEGSAEVSTPPVPVFNFEGVYLYQTCLYSATGDQWTTSAVSASYTQVVEFTTPAVLPVSGHWSLLGIGATGGAGHPASFIRLNSLGKIQILTRHSTSVGSGVYSLDGTAHGFVAQPLTKYTVHLLVNTAGAASAYEAPAFDSGSVSLPLTITTGFTYSLTTDTIMLTDDGTNQPWVRGVHFNLTGPNSIQIVACPSTGVSTLSIFKNGGRATLWINGTIYPVALTADTHSPGDTYNWLSDAPVTYAGARRASVGHQFAAMLTPTFVNDFRAGYIDGGSGDVPVKFSLAFFSTSQAINDPAIFYTPLGAPLLDGFIGLAELIMGHTTGYDAAAWAAGRNDGAQPGTDLTVQV